jgi:hypothetical protein
MNPTWLTLKIGANETICRIYQHRALMFVIELPHAFQ